MCQSDFVYTEAFSNCCCENVCFQFEFFFVFLKPAANLIERAKRATKRRVTVMCKYSLKDKGISFDF